MEFYHNFVWKFCWNLKLSEHYSHCLLLSWRYLWKHSCLVYYCFVWLLLWIYMYLDLLCHGIEISTMLHAQQWVIQEISCFLSGTHLSRNQTATFQYWRKMIFLNTKAQGAADLEIVSSKKHSGFQQLILLLTTKKS